MAIFRSIHTGEKVDEAVDIIQANVDAGSSETPVYMNEEGIAVDVNIAAAPVTGSNELVTSGGVKTALDGKFSKDNIATDINLGTSNVLVPSQNAAKAYTDNKMKGKQDVITAGEGVVLQDSIINLSSEGGVKGDELDFAYDHFAEYKVGYNGELAEELEKAKRSSFDKSKFTVVGNPTITDDGIASGFSASTRLDTGSTSHFIAKNKIELVTHVKFSNTPVISYNGIGGIRSSNGEHVLAIGYSAQNNFYLSTIGTLGQSIYNLTTLTLNSDYIFTYGIDLVNNYFYVSSIKKDGVELLTQIKTSSLTETDIDTNQWGAIIGATPTQAENYLSNGSIDLKQFSITVDGVEVFNGNKIGIDQIKKDDYTVVGSPIISADGIASGFSSSNYLQKTLNHAYSNNAIIYLPFQTSNDITTTQRIYFKDNPNNAISINNNTIVVVWEDINDNTISTGWLSNIVQPNKKYIVKIEDNSIKQIVSILDIASNIWTVLKEQNKIANLKLNGAFTIGKSIAVNQPFSGNIDLNSFKIYVDNQLVYQPTLRIPYTQTKDGRKIVNSNYRDRVEDMYNQAGYTPYYTLNPNSTPHYTITGSPVISADYLASGFSSSNYLSQNINIKPQKEIRFKGKLSYFQATAGSQIPFSFSTNNWRLELTTTIFRLHGTASSSVTDGALAYFSNLPALANNDEVIYDVKITPTEQVTEITWKGVKYLNKQTIAIADQYFNLVQLVLGNYGGNNVWQGAIPLKDFEIYVDGKLAYKAVETPNYTLASHREEDIIETYENGASQYTQRAGLEIEQQGHCTANSFVTLMKPYSDLTYEVSVPYSSKTTEGFTPTVTGDWIANGKTLLGGGE